MDDQLRRIERSLTHLIWMSLVSLVLTAVVLGMILAAGVML